MVPIAMEKRVQHNLFYGIGADCFGEGLCNLRGALNDVFALEKAFAGIGWSTRIFNEYPKEAIRRDIEQLHHQIPQDAREITLCFFFATHGVVSGENTWLALSGCGACDLERMISAAELTRWISTCAEHLDGRVLRSLFIFDACREEIGRGHSGSGRSAAAPVGEVFRTLSAELAEDKGFPVSVWFACSRDGGARAVEIRSPDGKARGLFSMELEQALREGRWSDWLALMQQVNHQVSVKSDGRQQPVFDRVDALRNSPVFATSYASASAPADVPSSGGTPPPRMPVPPVAVWHLQQNGRVCGPVTLDRIQAGLRDGTVTPQTPVWKEGFPEWTPIESVAELMLEYCRITL